MLSTIETISIKASRSQGHGRHRHHKQRAQSQDKRENEHRLEEGFKIYTAQTKRETLRGPIAT